jgi:ferrous iron transport protein A
LYPKCENLTELFEEKLFYELMKLSEVKTGTKVKIKSFENHEIVLKLMEMGCLPEEEITVWKKAPLGDPIYVLVAGYSLSLRLDEAEQIFVDFIVK